MKYIRTPLLLCLMACSQGEQTELPKTSKTQTLLSNLSKSFRSEYANAPNDIVKNEVAEKYKNRLHSYLVDTCKYLMDSMTVEITEIQARGTELKVSLRDRTTDYYFSNNYDSEELMKNDSIYNFVKTLKQGEEQTMKLFYLGNSDVSNIGRATFTIYAVPAPLNLIPKN